MIIDGKLTILVSVSFLLVVILGLHGIALQQVFGYPYAAGGVGLKCSNFGTGQQCCWYESHSNPITGQYYIRYCQNCYWGIGCDPPFEARTSASGGPLNPPSLGTALPPGNHTGTVTNGPPRLGTALPPSNSTGSITNGQTGLPSRLGNALPPSNNTGSPGKPPVNIMLSPGSIFKVPPGTTNTQPTGNNTGTLPALTVTKEHNPASPNVFGLAGNTTNPSNSTGPVKLSPLTTTTSGGHHHHKGGSTSSSSNTNSTGH